MAVPGSSEFAVEVVSRNGQRVVVRVKGEVDLATAPALEQRLNELVDEGARQISVDLAGLEFMDTTGLSVLVRVQQRLQGDDGRILLLSPNASVQKTLEITGLDRALLAR